MPSFQELLNTINTELVENGQELITADVMRPIVASVLEFTAQEVGDREDLETLDTSSIVAAINEILSTANDPTSVQPPLTSIVELSSNYTLANSSRGAVHLVGVQSSGGAQGDSEPITISIANDTAIGIGALPPPVGAHFDLFQTNAEHTPLIALGQNVVVYVEDGDTLTFSGIHSGIRLTKIAPNLWLFSRITESGGAFRKVGTGGLIVSPEDDKFTGGKVGLNEENPIQVLDVKGDTKQTYTHGDGTKLIIHAGDRLLDDIGVPAGVTKSLIMEMRGHPNYPTGQTYTFAGDASALNGFLLLAGIGVRDLTPGNQNESRMTTFAENSNPLDKSAQILASNANGNYAGISSNNGANVDDPSWWLFANKVGKAMNIYGTPYAMEVGSGRIDLTSYGGSFPFKEGYDHGDGEVIGPPERTLAIDAQGRLQTTSENITRRVVLTTNQLINLHTTPVELVPPPGAGNVIIPREIVLANIYNTLVFEEEEVTIKQGAINLRVNVPSSLTEEETIVNRFRLGSDGFNSPLNTAITIEAPSDMAQGEPQDGELIVYVTYRVLDIL